MIAERTTTRLERVLEFLRRADERASTSVRPLRLGIAYFHAGLPRVHDRNFLLVTHAGEEVDAGSLAAAAHELHRSEGLDHRKVVFEDETTGERVAPALGAAGWEYRRLSIMAYGGGADSEAGAGASEVDRGALAPALEALIRAEPWGGDEEIVRQLAAADAALERALSQRCFARLVRGRVVSSCRLYSDGAIAQVEDVATLPGHRRRGYAAAVVTRALQEASAAHDLVFLTAVDGRWVKSWYERLGFEQIGLRYEATLAP